MAKRDSANTQSFSTSAQAGFIVRHIDCSTLNLYCLLLQLHNCCKGDDKFISSKWTLPIKPLNIGNYKNETRGPQAELVHRSNATSRKVVTRVVVEFSVKAFALIFLANIKKEANNTAHAKSDKGNDNDDKQLQTAHPTGYITAVGILRVF